MNAREYVGQGLAVLPLEPGEKAPLGRLVRRGLHDATRDLATVEKWWRAEPEANIGLRTGEGLAVLDVDRRHGGEETLGAYLHNTGARIPLTPEVATGGDGRHLYFAAPSGIPSSRLGPGLDLKATGGYVVAPPSVHPNGRLYTWQLGQGLGEVPLAKLPAALARASRAGSATPGAASATPGAHEWASLVLEGVREGERNATAARLAGRCLRLGLDPAEVFGLLGAWDADRNRPPLGAEEILRVVRSIAAREARRLRDGAA